MLHEMAILGKFSSGQWENICIIVIYLGQYSASNLKLCFFWVLNFSDNQRRIATLGEVSQFGASTLTLT